MYRAYMTYDIYIYLYMIYTYVCITYSYIIFFENRKRSQMSYWICAGTVCLRCGLDSSSNYAQYQSTRLNDLQEHLYE